MIAAVEKSLVKGGLSKENWYTLQNRDNWIAYSLADIYDRIHDLLIIVGDTYIRAIFSFSDHGETKKSLDEVLKVLKILEKAPQYVKIQQKCT